jgi:tetratricopeptide (TPR) repeat protein
MQEEMKKIEQTLGSGEYQQAFMELMDLNGKESTAEIVFKMGETMEKMQNFAMAAVYYEELLTKFPGSEYDDKARRNLSRYYVNYDGTDLLSVGSEAGIMLEKGLKAFEEGDLHRALLMLKKGLLQHTNHYLLNFHLGRVYYDYYRKFGQRQARYLDLSLSAFMRAARLNPSAKVYHNMACVFAEQGDSVMAARYFQRASSAADTPALKALIVKSERNFLLRTESGEYRFLQEMIQ